MTTKADEKKRDYQARWRLRKRQQRRCIATFSWLLQEQWSPEERAEWFIRAYGVDPNSPEGAEIIKDIEQHLKGECHCYDKQERPCSIRGLAKLLEVPKSTMYRWIQSGTLDRSKVSKKRRKGHNASIYCPIKRVNWER